MRIIINAFNNDKRVVMWDLYNEVGNSGYGVKKAALNSKNIQMGSNSQPQSAFDLGTLERWSKF